MNDLEDRTALITGATGGIGLQIARSLASAGCRIVANAVDTKEAIDRARVEISAAGAPDVVFSDGDLRDADCARKLVQVTEEQFGRLDILVNNAGVQHVRPIETFADEDWNRVVDINLSAPFRLIKHALPVMRTRKWGRVVNIASAHGLVASAHKSAYVSAKHGLVGLTKTVALETADAPITCNAICPGFVHTPLIQSQIDAHAAENGLDAEKALHSFLGQKQPSKAFVAPADIGAMVVFLCSDAGAQITGASLSIDGGWTAQ